ncbi:hypothetical protein ACSBL2_16835 [Pedobacter sp. AW31-3R]|uniref:hypothetical protein n=1 Tax=Pedobacter sp. AW31-3R TaxID=3445781 RepID=UPI003F9FF15A
MPQFVIILSTVINNSAELESINHAIASTANIIEWNHDLDDDDKVLRIVSKNNISQHLLLALQNAGVSSALLGVFKRTKTRIVSYLQ